MRWPVIRPSNACVIPGIRRTRRYSSRDTNVGGWGHVVDRCRWWPCGRRPGCRGARVDRNATSLGGTETLVEHRKSTEGPETTTPENLLRFSIGLEHPDDLIADIARALDSVR